MIDQRGLAFTPQQMSGYKGYSRGVLVGNWQEDLNVLEEKMRLNVEGRKTSTVLPVNARVTPSPIHPDGALRYGSRVQVVCCEGSWLLSIFPGKPKADLAPNNVYVSGAQPEHGVGPIGRNVWTIRKAAKDIAAVGNGNGDARSSSSSSTVARGGTGTGTEVVKFGDKVILVNEWGSADGHLCLCSEQKSVLSAANGGGVSKRKDSQEVSACYGETTLGNFTVEPAGVAAGLNVTRFDGKPVSADSKIVFRHTLTGVPLGIDSNVKIRGPTGEVECTAACFFDKDAGARVKSVTSEANMFTLVLSASGTPDALPTHLPSAEQVFEDLLKRLRDRSGGAFEALRGLARTFRLVDRNRDLKLSRTELKGALTKFMGPSTFSNREVDMIFAAMDRNKDGKISTTEFYRFLRGDMNPRREKLVMQAFRILAPDASYVPFAEMKRRFGAALPRHPEVLSGKKSEDEVMRDFIATWDKNRDDTITSDEFLDYYNDLSCSIDHDDYFELVIRNAWHMSGGDGWCENTSNKRVLVTHSDGSQEIVECKNDLGLDFKNRQELIAFLKRQGVEDIVQVDLHGGQ